MAVSDITSQFQVVTCPPWPDASSAVICCGCIALNDPLIAGSTMLTLAVTYMHIDTHHKAILTPIPYTIKISHWRYKLC